MRRPERSARLGRLRSFPKENESSSVSEMAHQHPLTEDVAIHAFVDLTLRRAFRQLQHRVERDGAKAITMTFTFRRARSVVTSTAGAVETEASIVADAGEVHA